MMIVCMELAAVIVSEGPGGPAHIDEWVNPEGGDKRRKRSQKETFLRNEKRYIPQGSIIHKQTHNNATRYKRDRSRPLK